MSNIKQLIAVNICNRGKLFQVGWFSLQREDSFYIVRDFISLTSCPEYAESFFDEQDALDVINMDKNTGQSFMRRIQSLKNRGYVLTPEVIDFDELQVAE